MATAEVEAYDARTYSQTCDIARESGSFGEMSPGSSRREYSLKLYHGGRFVTLAQVRYDRPTWAIERAMRVLTR